MARRLVLLLTGSLILAGCGFHLRGSVNLPTALNSVYVTGPDRELVERLSDALAQSGATIRNSADGAVVINMTTARFEREVRTTDASGLASGYTFDYAVVYDVTDTNGERLQSGESVNQSRTLDYDPTQELQAQEEENFLKREMQQEIVVQMLRRLSRI